MPNNHRLLQRGYSNLVLPNLWIDGAKAKWICATPSARFAASVFGSSAAKVLFGAIATGRASASLATKGVFGEQPVGWPNSTKADSARPERQCPTEQGLCLSINSQQEHREPIGP